MDAKYILAGAALLGGTAGFIWSAVPTAAASESPASTTATAENQPTAQPTAVEVDQNVYYAGCNEVRAAGKAPLYASQPGYSERMDGDSDGVACEPVR